MFLGPSHCTTCRTPPARGALLSRRQGRAGADCCCCCWPSGSLPGPVAGGTAGRGPRELAAAATEDPICSGGITNSSTRAGQGQARHREHASSWSLQFECQWVSAVSQNPLRFSGTDPRTAWHFFQESTPSQKCSQQPLTPCRSSPAGWKKPPSMKGIAAAMA